ncbi:MAG: Nif3-like dinuclear metal center hexameric protein [Thermodesulfobacteriota bacterium]|nr:Nif3-like dinuclear metal center hexameric protein [Thermodesulfobacteriota bacterium]
MNKTPCMRLQDLVGLLNRHYPQNLAEDWDNVGLQVGDLKQEITKVLVALEPTIATVQTAIKLQCQALITHHPLIFKPLKKITPSDETGQILFSAIRNNLAIISVHTNLDHAANGLNDWLAQALHLVNYKPLLLPKAGNLLKLVVFVPHNNAETIAAALFKAGAGHVGHYDHCSFRSDGTGSFRATEGCTPHIGTIGSDEQVNEIRLETIVPRALINKVVEKMIKVHPYEEVAYDLLPLDNRRNDIGLGRIGYLETPQQLDQFAERCKQYLGCNTLRMVAAGDTPIRKVAVCGGSGAQLIHEAARQGADVLVTGDIKYHEAMSARAIGLALIDAGHFATEQLMANRLAKKLAKESQQRSWSIDYIVATDEIDPFSNI